MKKPLLCLCLAAIFLASGCASVNYSDKGGVSTVVVANTGWYFLNLIPLASGDPDEPGCFWPCLFRQKTTLANNIKMLDYAVTEKNALGVRDVTTHTTDESVLFILFKRHAIYTSAELVFNREDADWETDLKPEE